MVNFIITCDGGSRGNGSADSEGYGTFMIEVPEYRSQPAQFISTREYGKGVTNNEAEYQALIDALEHIAEAFKSVGSDLKTVDITVRTDSALVIGQLSQGWKVNKPHLVPYVRKAKGFIVQFNRVAFEKVPEKDMKIIIGH